MMMIWAGPRKRLLELDIQLKSSWRMYVCTSLVIEMLTLHSSLRRTFFKYLMTCIQLILLLLYNKYSMGCICRVFLDIGFYANTLLSSGMQYIIVADSPSAAPLQEHLTLLPLPCRCPAASFVSAPSLLSWRRVFPSPSNPITTRIGDNPFYTNCSHLTGEPYAKHNSV